MNYLITPPSPTDLIRSLRREFRARMLGAGVLAGTLAVAPFVFACSCPSYHVRYAHPLPPGRAMEAAELDDDDAACALLCGGPVESCEQARLIPGDPGPASRNRYSTVGQNGTSDEQASRSEPAPLVICEVIETETCGIGRPPEGLLASAPQPRQSALGAYAAHAAHIEAASAIAFVQFATELEAHGAPSHFVRAAERSAADEVRHARAASRLARSLGAKVYSPRVSIPAPRRLQEVLRENASVGGVEEGYGAWVLQHQATSARHRGVRQFAAAIRTDEARHGHLAHAIESWGQGKLTPAQRVQNAESRDLAWAKQLECLELPAPDFSADLGLPSVDVAGSWLEAARETDARV